MCDAWRSKVGGRGVIADVTVRTVLWEDNNGDKQSQYRYEALANVHTAMVGDVVVLLLRCNPVPG